MSIRLNLSLILICLILINFKLILINEETLILICFSTFCFLTTSRLSTTIITFFKTQAEAVKADFISSSSKLIQTSEVKKVKLQTKQVWPQVFTNLKKDFKLFNSFILGQFSSFYHTQLQKKIQKKLEFSSRLETQLTKILVLIITEKLQNFVKLQNFYQAKLKVVAFKTIKKIYFREHLQKLAK